MATWTSKYNDDLRAAYSRHLVSQSRSGSVVRPGPQDIAYQMLQRNAKNRHLTSDATGTASKSMLRRSLDVGKYLLEALGTGNYAVANAVSASMEDRKKRAVAKAVAEGRPLDPKDLFGFSTAGIKGAWEGALAGLTPGHQEGQKMFGDVFKENHIAENNPFFRGAAGLVFDIAADPLTYAGGIGIGRRAAQAAGEAALEKGVQGVIKHGDQAVNETTKVTKLEGENAFDTLWNGLKKDTPERKPFEYKQEGPFELPAGPSFTPGSGFAASADGVIEPTRIWTKNENPFGTLDDFNPDAPARLNIRESPADYITARTRFDTIQEQVEKIPWYRYPDNLDVTPTVKEVTERVAPKMPKQKRGKEDILPEGAAGPSMAHTWATGIGEAESKRIAARHAILGDDNYQVRMKSGKPYKLTDLYKTAYGQADPKKRERMLKMIDDEVNKGVEAILKGDDIREVPVYMRGASDDIRRTGGISVESLAKFIRDGMVGKPSRYESAPAESLLSGKGLSKEALEQDEFLAKYPVADPDEINSFLLRTSQGEHISIGRLFADVNKANWVEAMGKDVKKIKKLDKASKLAWRAKYADVLDPADMDNLLAATSLKDFKTRLSGIMAAEGPRRSGLDGLEQGIKEGLIRKDDLKPLMNALGVTKIERLVPKIREAGEELVKLERAAKKNDPTPVLEDFLEEGIEGWAKTTGYSPDATFDSIVHAIDNVTPAEELINKVKQGNATDFLVNKNKLDPTQVAMYESAFQRAWALNIIDPKDYPFVTSILRAKRTHKKMYEGKARNWRGWNKHSQADVYRSIINDINDVLSTQYQGVKGAGRSRAVYDYAMPVLRAVEDTLKANGVPMILGKGNEGIPLGLFDVLNSLPRNLVENHLFDFGRSLAPTQFNDIAEILVKFGTKHYDSNLALEGIRAILLSPIKKANPKAKPFTPMFLHWMRGTNPKNPKFRFRGDPKVFIDALARDFLESTPVLMQQLERNAAQFKLATDAMAKPITDEVITNVTKMFQNPAASNGDRIEMLDNIDNLAEAIGRHNNASSHARQAAKDDLKVQAGESVDAGAAFEAKAGKTNSAAAKKNGGTVPKQTAFGTAELRYGTNQELVDKIAPELDLPGRIEMGFMANLARAFNPHFNVGDLRRLYNEGNTAGEASSRAFQHLANRAAKNHTEEDIKRAWLTLQLGKPPQTVEVAAALRDLQTMTRNVFDTNETYNSIRRFGLDADQINRWMKHYGVPEMFRFDPQDMAGSWKKWEDVHDPLDLITRVNAAVQHAQTLSVTGASFTHFGKQAGAISASARPGFKRLSGKGIEEIAPFINLNLHYSDEAVENLRFFNQFLREAKVPLGQNKFARTWDSAMHAIKAGYTIYRPGHHVRNMVGNISLNFLAGMTSPRYYKDALRMLSNQRGRMGDWDKITALRNSPVELGSRLNAENATTKLRINGQMHRLSDEQVVKLAHQHGVLPDYQALEDIQFAASAIDSEAGFAAKLPKRLRQPFGGNVRKFAGMTSQLNDHMARLAQFAWELERKSYKGNLDDIAQMAARRVRKWHPDGTDLTNFERRGMRRAILFYSWQRKIIPLVAESILTRPGRVMVYPKAYYNFAQSMGLDLNSLADPFPQDQLFPSWMTDQATGPLFQTESGNYMGVNPGVVQTDVLNQYGSPDKFMRATLGGITPFVKVPFELATNTDVATGARIMDKSEYLDRQIPMVGSIGGMFNKSVTGGLEDKREVSKGYENAGMDPNAAINFFTGLGLTNMSKPNYIKSAEFELKDQARKDSIEWEKNFRGQFG